MNFGKTCLFTSVGLILLILIYNTKKPLKSQEYRPHKNSLSILDEIELSEHKYEISDCLIKQFRCNSDKECSQICNHNMLSWACIRGYCSVDTHIPKINCKFGTLRAVYDDFTKELKYNCVCDSLHYGVDCSKALKFCDKVKDNRCVCNEDSIRFRYYNSIDVCIPLKHNSLFSSQDHFKRT